MTEPATTRDAWEALVAVAMLGTDRRDPPEPVGSIADVVDDTVRTTPSERMLAQVAAMVAVRRAGVVPGPPRPRLPGPPDDDRPICAPAAADRWRHVVASWPVLEDEWMLTLIENGWRIPPELVPDVLTRHRRDEIRRERVELAAGPLAGWLADLVPELAARPSRPSGSGRSKVDGLPVLPIPPDLVPLLTASGRESGPLLVHSIRTGSLVHSHRAVLVNLLARVRPDALDGLASSLESVDGATMGFPLASVLADLARTRQLMLDELAR